MNEIHWRAPCSECGMRYLRGTVFGIDPNYPQDGNVALICQNEYHERQGSS